MNIPDQCQNPTIDCRAPADVEIKHEHYNEDGSELLEVSTLGWLCQGCAMTVVLNRVRPAPPAPPLHTLN